MWFSVATLNRSVQQNSPGTTRSRRIASSKSRSDWSAYAIDHADDRAGCGIRPSDVAEDLTGRRALRVGAPEQPRARGDVVAERVEGESVELDGALHVVELPDVEVAAVACRCPRNGSETACSTRCMPTTRKPCAMRGDALGDAGRLRDAAVLRQDRLAGLLHLQQERILVGALQKLQVAARPDAADADHAPREIGRLVLREHGVDVDAHRVAILREQRVDRFGALRTVAAGSHRRDGIAPWSADSRRTAACRRARARSCDGPLAPTCAARPRRARRSARGALAAQLAPRGLDVEVHEVAAGRAELDQPTQHRDVLGEGARRDARDVAFVIARLAAADDRRS